MPNERDTGPAYPKRAQFFACRFAREMTARDLPGQLGSIGPSVCWLLTVVVMTQDEQKHRGRPVPYFSRELAEKAGFAKRTFERLRDAAIKAGWLHYSPGSRSKHGLYWVTIPDEETSIDTRQSDACGDTTCADPARVEGSSCRTRDAPSYDRLPLTDSREESAHARFVPPTVEEVAAYCRERGNQVNPQRFHDYYTANGWLQGRQRKPNKDWKASVRSWESNGFNNGTAHGPANREADIVNYFQRDPS